MNQKQKDYLKSYKYENNLMFVWDVGVWKTFTMSYMEKQLLNWKRRNENWIDSYWIDDWEFREKISSWVMRLKPIEENISWISYPLEMMSRAKVLFYDDLWSSENISEAQKTKFKYILDERKKRNLITIYTTNLSMQDIENLYWERIKSRIFQNITAIVMQGEDRRKENFNPIK